MDIDNWEIHVPSTEERNAPCVSCGAKVLQRHAAGCLYVGSLHLPSEGLVNCAGWSTGGPHMLPDTSDPKGWKPGKYTMVACSREELMQRIIDYVKRPQHYSTYGVLPDAKELVEAIFFKPKITVQAGLGDTVDTSRAVHKVINEQ